ncbi:hypothetical protein [Paenibacillus spongiae]|uniref:Serine/threonine protein kinase n=1 Tax=Paenibacillus spongiae TaxID=2909671 RepID=A0ABY5S407_9BACL|nr:hypothetical protein [Paenibacillus spongiae]UVI28641.1 hypothetical protein L1F29_24800 [Paenibacillus spongiae]
MKRKRRTSSDIVEETKRSTMLSDRDLESIRHWIMNMKRKSKNKLRLKYTVIGSGKTRIVYDLENGYVVKVALSKKGLTSNQKELHLYNRCSRRLRKHLCPVIEYGNGWIIMKKISRIEKLTEEYEKKLPRLRKKFLKEGIEARSLRSKNLAISSDNRIIVIDYGSFRYDD